MDETMEQNRQQVLDYVAEAVPVFKRLDELYLCAFNIDEQLNYAHAVAVRAKERNLIRKLWIKRKSYNLIAIIPWIFVSTFFVFVDFYTRGRVSVPMDIPNYCLGLIGIGLLVIALYSVVLSVRLSRNFISHHDVYTGGLSQREESLYDADIKEISNEISKVTAQNKAVIAKIPRDYRNHNAVAFFEYALANQRAYSMQEAVNLYEQHLYQLRMEDKNRQLLEQAQKQTRLLREIEFNTDFATTYMIMRDILG